jgi:dihydropteroate synthase
MVKSNANRPIFTLNCRGRLLAAEKPLVMGILNLTPDSFYAGSRVETVAQVVERAGQMLEAGAALLDVGAQSTRPGSVRLTVQEELQRVVEPIQAICRHFPQAIISVDTYWAEVAEAAVEAGATIINDISGGRFDKQMLATAARLQTPFICMHLPSSPENLHHVPAYENVITAVVDYFIQKKEQCERAGIHDLIMDPGFGFGKSLADNYTLLAGFSALHITGLPVLAGLSRKSMIQKVLHITAPEALNGSTVLHTIALMAGASILRVHDIREAVEAVTLVSEIKKSVQV